MESIRTKDKIFLALVGPIALAAAYVYFWRTDATRQIESLTRENAALVSVEDFPVERQHARQRLKAATDEQTAEEKIPMPAARVKAKADDSIAARERMVLGVFHRAGLTVGRSENSDEGDSSVRDVLNRTGFRPVPVCRRYAVVGNYPQVCAALRTFADREMAVLPDRLEMTSAGRWTLILWL